MTFIDWMISGKHTLSVIWVVVTVVLTIYVLWVRRKGGVPFWHKR